MSGTAEVNQQREVDGSTGLAVRWDHRQTFDMATSLNLSFNYASNTTVLKDNALDPLQNTQQITSQLNFSKRYGWGTLTPGRQPATGSLTSDNVQQLLPAVTLSPVPIAIGADLTWSPGLSFTNNINTDAPAGTLLQVSAAGGVDTIALTSDSRVTAFNFDTPIRLGSFNWSNSLQVTDQTTTGRESVTFSVDDPSTPDPTDSVTVNQVFTGSFQSSLDWDTGITLPVLFRGSWKVQPSVGIANAAAGQPFMIRNRNTNGDWVQQGKRFRFGASASPTLFGFYPGIGPISRIRHSFSPVINYNYEPAADVSEEFARAIAGPGRPVELRSAARQQLTVGLSQAFEGKEKSATGDTTSAERAEDPTAQHQHQRRHLRLRAGQGAGAERLGHRRDHQLVPERPRSRVQPEPHARPVRGRRRNRQRAASRRFFRA